MKILLSGPIEGHLKPFYEHAKVQRPHWIVCAGDFGVWPDPARMDRASKKHAGKDFARAYIGGIILPPIPTLVVSGVHDDNEWLKRRQDANNTEILSNVHWLAQGFKTTIGFDVSLRVTGLGKAHSPETYSGSFGTRSYRHYTRADIERACASGPTDLLVLYEHIDAPGLRNVAFATRPKLILNVEHPNQKQYDNIQGIPIVHLGRQETKLVEWDGHTFL